LGKLHDAAILEGMRMHYRKLASQDYACYRRLNKYLLAMSEESTINSPWYYDIHWLAKRQHLSLPKMDVIIEKIHNAGYHASITHFSGKGIKTAATFKELTQVLKQYFR
jgi:tRNA G26 N,N-dimethylase Trm1